MSSTISLLLLCFARSVTGDLRIASRAGSGYGCAWKDCAKFGSKIFYKYMMPANFSYRNLYMQELFGHDQFLRSNIDNEHDARSFISEPGQDALPFRTLNAEVRTHYTALYGKNPKVTDVRATVKPGESMLVPLRWNNPHSSELEVNIWILEGQGDKPVVVPIRRPTCSGEGYQDNIISFTVPVDFKTLGAKIPGFKGCNVNTKPMCVVQIYSHSVESRTYATAFPIIIPGHDDSLRTSSEASIQAVSRDPKLNLGMLRDFCLPTTDPLADIPNAIPRWGRLVSDVYNHAYQNSDFSPYSGQQHEGISRNLQAAAINKMVVGDRGELGRYILTAKTSERIKALQTLEDSVYKTYESLANKIIKAIGKDMRSTGSITADSATQHLANCFRCGEIGTITANRLETNTYIPSFQLPQSLMAKAKTFVPAKYAGLISSSGQVQIYVAALTDLLPFYFVSAPYGIIYQQAMPKTTLATKVDAAKFMKRTQSGYNYDRGIWASTQAKKEFAKSFGCPERCLSCKEGLEPLIKGAAATCIKDDCSKCTALFGEFMSTSPPAVTALASTIATGGDLPSAGTDKIKNYADQDGTPRWGRPRNEAARPPEKEQKPFRQPGWDLKSPTQRPAPAPTEPPTEAPTDGPAPAPEPAPGNRRRSKRSSRRRSNRRRSKKSSRRRRSPREGDVVPTRRRRQRRHRRRRSAAKQ